MGFHDQKVSNSIFSLILKFSKQTIPRKIGNKGLNLLCINQTFEIELERYELILNKVPKGNIENLTI